MIHTIILIGCRLSSYNEPTGIGCLRFVAIFRGFAFDIPEDRPCGFDRMPAQCVLAMHLHRPLPAATLSHGPRLLEKYLLLHHDGALSRWSITPNAEASVHRAVNRD